MDKRSLNNTVMSDIGIGDYRNSNRSRFPSKRNVFVALVIIIFLTVIVGLSVKLHIANQRKDTIKERKSSKCELNIAHRISGNIDEKKKPCDDFWLHSCGGYIKSHSSNSRRERSVKAEMQLSTDKKVIGLLEEPTTESTIEPVKMLRKFYRSCTDEVTIQKTMKNFVDGLSGKLGGVPIVTGGKYSSDHATTLRTLFHVTGELLWLQYHIMDDPKNNHKIINLRLKFNCNVNVLLDTLSTITLLFRRSLHRIDNVLNFCQQTSQMPVSIDLPTGDNFFNGKIYTESDISQHLPGFDLVSLFKYIVNISSETASSFLFIIDDMSILKRFAHLVLETDATDFMNIAFLQLLQEFYGVIPNVGIYFADSIWNQRMTQKYNLSNSNLSSIPAKKQTCLDLAYLASDVLGWMYSKEYFKKQVQEQAKNIAKYLEKSMEKVLSESKWLTQESLQMAKKNIKKLSKKVHVGSQHSDHAKAVLIKRYENLHLTDNFFENVFALKKRHSQLMTSDMLKNNLNLVSDMDIQAIYYVVNNSIHIPIAMLQPPLFCEGAQMAINFGGLGTLIGHEILHAFQTDFENPYFNGKWLSDGSQEKYIYLREAIVNIYSGYKIESMNFTVNGQRTAEENIADIGALKIAYEAYLLWKSDHPDANTILPSLEMTDLQLFFIAFAQSWCSTVKSAENYIFENAVHAPMEARVQVPLKNSKDFAEAFSCEKGSNMNPDFKSEMWAKQMKNNI